MIKESKFPVRLLFWLIDSKIEKLENQEKTLKSNRTEVEHRLDKLEFTLRGRLSKLPES